jgi:deoxyribodipyrimidine photo-lyase
MKKAVFIFHRDLRLTDNTALIKSIQDGYQVLPIFIFPPEQIQPKKNPYFSHPAVQFMCESLIDLDTQQLQPLNAKLYFFKGQNTAILTKLYKQYPFDAIYFNQDYSVYATERDQAIQEWSNKKNILCIQAEDYGLLPLREGLVEQGTPEERPYLILAQFYNRVMNTDIRKPNPFTFSPNHFLTPSLTTFPPINLHTLYTPTKDLAIHGGRTKAITLLDTHLKTLKDYQTNRNYPALQQTSKASPHLKFGTISIREMYDRVKSLFGKSHGLIRELVFRDFYLKIYALKPELQRGKALYHTLDQNIPWSYDQTLFNAWANAKTGYPLVDAGMRELNQTAHQHNRIRMLCGSVLTKYFLIDWRLGLKYYYTHLVDADIYSNTAGWGFVSSTGPDGVPYFRAPFNPYIQSKKYDPDALYIKHWLPELKDVPPKDIHKWYDPTVRAKYPTIQYPSPILDHTQASARALVTFKNAHR